MHQACTHHAPTLHLLHPPRTHHAPTMHLPRLGLGLDFLTLALTAHQVAMEGPLEDVLQRLSLDASDFLQQLAKGTHEVS